jgi:hypothetical protein
MLLKRIAPACLSLCVVALLLSLVFPSMLATDAAAQGSANVALDKKRLEVIEDLSESLANDLLELSVITRNCDLQRTADFFPAKLSASPFPARASAAKNRVKWIDTHGWEADATDDAKAQARSIAATPTGTPAAAAAPTSTGAPANALREMPREEFLRAWESFLEHFSEIEDVRFKVKEAQFEDGAQAVVGAKEPTAVVGAGGRARVAFYVIGRDAEGKREWARGVTNVTVRYAAPGRWQFESWSLASLDSMVASTDIFSEVAVPAGVAAQRPAFGTQGNTGFVWHGAAAADFNRDGWVDLFVTAPDRNYLYLNDRQGRFRDASAETNSLSLATGTAPLTLDFDNDGDEDVFISSVGNQILLENRLVPDGKLDFQDISLEAGVAKDAIGFSAVAGDINGDGRLDIYVTSYNRYGQVTPNSWFRATNGTPNLLFVSQPDGTFREEASKWGVDDARWSYAAAFADVNEDGKLDLYVANDFGEKAMFVNRGDKFVDEAKERGVLDPGNGMGVSFGDFNNDGRLDLHTTNMSSTAGNRILSRLFPNSNPKDNVLKKLAAGNNLFENLGQGKYRDVTAEVGGFGGGWAWGGGFIDFDNDGWEDIFTPNGFISGKSMKDT